MATYLLLRDNKESGPHTLDALVKLGLKAYDLVWIEGKSAAWRYPSEIEELKPFAPVVEEQPFDRFFKKPTEEIYEEVLPELNKVQPADNYERYLPPQPQPVSNEVPKRSVFVTLPGGNRVNTERPRREQPAPASSPAPKTTQPPIIDEEANEVAEIKFSQPLDEIKEMYVKTLQDRKSRKARKSLVIAGLKKAAVIVALVGVGLLTGFLIRKKPQATTAIPQQQVPAANFTNHITPADTPVDDAGKANDNVVAQESVSSGQQAEDLVNEEELERTQRPATEIRIRKETMIEPKEKKQFDETHESPGVDVDPVTGERKRKTRNADMAGEPKAVLKNPKHELINQVSVTTNDYKRVAFGGIRNLQLTVTNNSKFDLDNVVVELQYLKPSEEPLRTENIRFKAIAPNASETVRVPDTNRGIMVTYKIISIETKQRTDDVAGM